MKSKGNSHIKFFKQDTCKNALFRCSWCRNQLIEATISSKDINVVNFATGEKVSI